jgi:hypothetical protein
MTYTSGCPERLEVKTTRRPSGLKLGETLIVPRATVMRRDWASPLSPTMKRSEPSPVSYACE